MDITPSKLTVDILPFNEWRVETSNSSTMTLKLESGTCEIFGTELSPAITYVFKNAMKFAVATYQGCQISYTVSSPLASEYLSEETTLKQTLNLHFALENAARSGKSPRVMIIGPKDSGKTTLARTLSAYSLKTSKKEPILVNLDPSLPHFSISTQLTATKLHDMLDVETSTMGESVTTGPGNGIYRSQIPLVKNFGLEKFNNNLELYKSLISELAFEVDCKISKSELDSGTVIIDTPFLNVSNWSLIQHVIDSFRVDVLLVVGNERLLVDLRKKLTLPTSFSMIKVPRSSGSVEKEPAYERELQQRSIKQYFYGIERSQLNPYTLHCSSKDFIFLKVKEHDPTNMAYLDFMNGDVDDDNSGSYAAVKQEDDNDGNYDPSSDSNSAIPDGIPKRAWKYGNMFTKIDDPKESDFINAVISIIDDKGLDMVKLMSNKLDESEKLDIISKHATTSSVLGCAYISGFDESTGKLKLIVPSPVSTLPGKIIVVTEMRYLE